MDAFQEIAQAIKPKQKPTGARLGTVIGVSPLSVNMGGITLKAEQLRHTSEEYTAIVTHSKGTETCTIKRPFKVGEVVALAPIVGDIGRFLIIERGL